MLNKLKVYTGLSKLLNKLFQLSYSLHNFFKRSNYRNVFQITLSVIIFCLWVDPISTKSFPVLSRSGHKIVVHFQQTSRYGDTSGRVCLPLSPHCPTHDHQKERIEQYSISERELGFCVKLKIIKNGTKDNRCGNDSQKD